MKDDETIRVAPQRGPQTDFLSTPADIAIYGGAAGGGKTWALLLEALRHHDNPGFGAVIFRRTTVEVRSEGGLWDASARLYPLLGAQPAGLSWRFPSGASVSFAHLEHETTALRWQGAEVPLICFDELTHFSAWQFWYLLSRNRSTCGVRPYVRAACNPDADSWVARLIAWWIDEETGLPRPERSGGLRWFVRVGDELTFADDPQDLARWRGPDGRPLPPKSLTFVPAKLQDNAVLMAKDPSYAATLMALPSVERARLHDGNWKIRAAAGLLFRRGWVEAAERPPPGLRSVRGWDLAATPEAGGNDPDWTCGTKIGRAADGTFWVLDHVRLRGTPGEVERLIRNTASQDGPGVLISVPRDPGQAGKWQVRRLAELLAGFVVRATPEQGDKVTRFSPFSAQAEAGAVKVVRGAWNEAWFCGLEAFPPERGGHDDDADSTSRAFNALTAATRDARPLRLDHMGR